MLHLDFSTPAFAAALLCGAVIILSLYCLSRISIIPGHPRTFSLLLDDAPIHQSSMLSPLSSLYGRHQWNHLAQSRGLSSAALARQILPASGTIPFDPSLGTPVSSFDRVVVCDENLISGDVLDEWSRQGDVLADRAVHALAKRTQNGHRPNDTLDRMMEIEAALEDKSDEISAFLASADRRPPMGCGAVSQSWYDDKARRNETFTELDELAEQTAVLRRARTFFLANGHTVFACLLHAGLIGGFASPRIIKVLNGTGYLLAPSSNQQRKKRNYTKQLSVEEGQALLDEVTVSTQKCKDRVYRRLLETLHFLLDVVEDDASMSPPCMASDSKVFDGKASDLIRSAGMGWLAATRVRLLHAGVRKRLCPSGLTGAEDIVPISQDEMVGTLCLFSVATLWSLDRMGLSPSKQQRSDYVSMWRHVGYYMGIEPSILARTFRDDRSAGRAYACIASYHFRGVSISPGPETLLSRGDFEAEAVVALRGPALPLLHSVAGRPGAGLHFSVHIALTRYLLGDSMADALYLPKTNISQSFFLHLLIMSLVIPSLFVKYYPRKKWTQRLARVQQRVYRDILSAALQKSESSMGEADRKQGFLDVSTMEKSKQQRTLLLDNILLVGEVITVCLVVSALALAPVYLIKNHF